MAKYLTDSTDIEIEEVSGTENLKFNLASGNSVEQMIGDLSVLNTTDKSNVVNAINEVNNSTIYSTIETPIGTWINGKTIYRKVINFGSLPNATTKTVAHNLINLDEIVYFYARAYDGTTFRILPVSSPQDITYNVDIYINQTNIVILTGNDRTNYNAYVIIEYTKN